MTENSSLTLVAVFLKKKPAYSIILFTLKLDFKVHFLLQENVGSHNFKYNAVKVARIIVRSFFK
jgi:hypothetical protein